MSKRGASQDLDHDPILAKKFSHLKITSHGDLAAAQDFALSILENRELAQYVRHVTLNYDHWSTFPAQALPYTVDTDEEREKETRFKAAIVEQKWEDPDTSELLKRLMTTDSEGFNKETSHQLLPDAVVALLLPILPNVEKWTVGNIDHPPYVGKAIQRAKDGIFGSILVTHVEIIAHTPYSDGAWGDYSFPAFNVFQNLPNLQRISGKGIGSIFIEDSGCYNEIPFSASDVQEIDLKDCDLGGGCLSKIVMFSKGLTALTYRFGGRAGDGSTAFLYTPQLANILTPHRLTMRSLDIDTDSILNESLKDEIERWRGELKESMDRADAENAEKDTDSKSLNSQKSKAGAEKIEEAMRSDPYFPNLTNLRIGIELALRFAELSGKTLAEWLPASLEKLEFVGYRVPDESSENKVRELVELLPNLKVLNGVGKYIENGKELDDEEDFENSDEEADEDASKGDEKDVSDD